MEIDNSLQVSCKVYSSVMKTVFSKCVNKEWKITFVHRVSVRHVSIEMSGLPNGFFYHRNSPTTRKPDNVDKEVYVTTYAVDESYYLIEENIHTNNRFLRKLKPHLIGNLLMTTGCKGFTTFQV